MSRTSVRDRAGIPISRRRKPTRARGEPFLSQLAARAVLVPSPNEVKEYLQRHAKLRPILLEMIHGARKEFGHDAELAVTLYRDPEIDDQYLTVSVRKQSYDDHIMDKIEKISRRSHTKLARVSGHVLLTTDFGPPRGLNGV
jgi:hypothetical protein